MGRCRSETDDIVYLGSPMIDSYLGAGTRTHVCPRMFAFDKNNSPCPSCPIYTDVPSIGLGTTNLTLSSCSTSVSFSISKHYNFISSLLHFMETYLHASKKKSKNKISDYFLKFFIVYFLF